MKAVVLMRMLKIAICDKTLPNRCSFVKQLRRLPRHLQITITGQRPVDDPDVVALVQVRRAALPARRPRAVGQPPPGNVGAEGTLCWLAKVRVQGHQGRVGNERDEEDQGGQAAADDARRGEVEQPLKRTLEEMIHFVFILCWSLSNLSSALLVHQH